MPGLFERVATFVELHADELQITSQQRPPGDVQKARG
jgi:hypothetical protein